MLLRLLAYFFPSFARNLPPEVPMFRSGDIEFGFYYKLGPDGRTPVPCTSKQASEWFETADAERIVRKTDIGEHRVSTVFTSTVYDFDEHGPFLFEAMVLEGPFYGSLSRTRTWEESEIMHEEFCAHLRDDTFEEWARNNPRVKT
ncbi:MAG: hypothetical protein KJ587_07255 [Alphaproteobacteria bacterium]|nr:hypothetical protein [Alphaproteobacteria bacterium]